MRMIHVYAAILYGLSKAWAQSTVETASDGSNTSSDALVSTTSLSVDATTPSDSATVTPSVTGIASTILTTGDIDESLTVTTELESTLAESGSESASVADTPATTNAISAGTTPSTPASGESSVTVTSASPATSSMLPVVTDASKYLSHAFPSGAPQPTWATGQYYTMLATALYRVDRSFIQRTDYETIISAIESAANEAGADIAASVETSAWGWGIVTTNTWYRTGVPDPLKTEVVDYNNAWHSAASSVKALATAATSAGAVGAPPRYPNPVWLGAAAGFIGVVII